MHGGISIHISTPSYGISSEERISLRPIIVPLLYSIRLRNNKHPQ